MKYFLSFIFIFILLNCTPEVLVKETPCPQPEPCPEQLTYTKPEPCTPVPCTPVPCTESESESEITVGIVDVKRIMNESEGGLRLIERFNNTKEAKEYTELSKSSSDPNRKAELKKILLKKRQKLYLEAFGLIGWALEEKLRTVHLVISKGGQTIWPSETSTVVTKIFIEENSFNSRDITEELISVIK